MVYRQTQDAFGRAAHILAIRPERIHERLIYAFKELGFREMKAPAELQDELGKLMDYIKVSEPTEMGTRKDAIEAMSEDEACRVADELLAFERALSKF